MNTDELEAATDMARRRVLEREIQAKLHRWARDDPHRRFDDLFNLVADPAFLLVAWDRVRHNRGAKTAGVDGQSAYYVQAVVGTGEFLGRLRASLKDRSFCPVPVRERMIPRSQVEQAAPPGDRDRHRPGGPGVADLGAGADPGGGFPAVQLRASVPGGGLMTRLPRPGIWRPARMSGSSRVTSRHVSTEISPSGADGPAAQQNRRQARPGPGQGVPEGRNPRPGRDAARQ